MCVWYVGGRTQAPGKHNPLDLGSLHSALKGKATEDQAGNKNTDCILMPQKKDQKLLLDVLIILLCLIERGREKSLVLEEHSEIFTDELL